MINIAKKNFTPTRERILYKRLSLSLSLCKYRTKPCFKTLKAQFCIENMCIIMNYKYDI